MELDRFFTHPRSGAALLLLALAGCGGGGGGGGTATPALPADSTGALRAAANGEIASYFRARIERLGTEGMQAVSSPAGAVVPASASAGADGDTAFAGAPLQEQGVDEEDLLKASGSAMYSLHLPRWDAGSRVPARLAAARVQPDGTLQSAGAVPFAEDQWPHGMYLVPEVEGLAALTQRWPEVSILPMPAVGTSLPQVPPAIQPPAVTLHLYGTAGVTPTAQRRIEWDGRLVASRRIGNVLYVVSTWTPPLSGALSAANRTPEQVKEALAKLDSAALLPRMRIDGGAAEPLVQEASCLLQSDNASLALQLTTISAFDLSAAPVRPSSRCFVGDSSAIYVSRQNIYLATSRQAWIASPSAQTRFPDQTSTDIHKFALAGSQVEYRGSGQVRGHLGWDAEKVSQRMSEHEGLLRVLTFTGQAGRSADNLQAAPSPASLSVLREDASSRSLVSVATLPNSARPAPIGLPGEQVYAVHFAGPRAYVVTFRRTDPLYVLDLSAPADPKVAGELTMPGYSDYLFPLGDGHLLGVGRDASSDGVVAGIKLALFDVRDPALPRVLAQRVLGGRGSFSALDASRRGISILPLGSVARVALPVRLAAGQTTQQGLARWSADLAAGSLIDHPLVASPAASTQGSGPLWGERALQTAQGSYYLTGDHVVYTPAP